jgi:poly(U)-specific endoribonuclease
LKAVLPAKPVEKKKEPEKKQPAKTRTRRNNPAIAWGKTPAKQAAKQPAKQPARRPAGPSKSITLTTVPTAGELDHFDQAASKLWLLDVNRMRPGRDYELNLQHATSFGSKRDQAKEPLFKHFNQSFFAHRPTFRAFLNLLDNYEMETGVEENVTAVELKENNDFLELIMVTPVMQYCYRYCREYGHVGSSKSEWKRLLNELWFKLYRRGAKNDSSGFEHVFVGEIDARKHQIIGMHNWLQLYMQEKLGNLDYTGYIPGPGPRHLNQPHNEDHVVQIQFSWKNGAARKPMGTSFIGSSPEFEMALFTLAFLRGDEDNPCYIADHHMNIRAYSQGRNIGSIFPEISHILD